MHEHFGAVEADFQSYYGLDLREVLWGPTRTGARRLWSLITGLPPDGVVARAMLYGGRAWSNVDELLATLVEMTDFGNRVRFLQASKQGTQAWPPVEISRPTKETPEEPAPDRPARKQANASEMRQAFGDDIHYDYREGD